VKSVRLNWHLSAEYHKVNHIYYIFKFGTPNENQVIKIPYICLYRKLWNNQLLHMELSLHSFIGIMIMHLNCLFFKTMERIIKLMSVPSEDNFAIQFWAVSLSVVTKYRLFPVGTGIRKYESPQLNTSYISYKHRPEQACTTCPHLVCVWVTENIVTRIQRLKVRVSVNSPCVQWRWGSCVSQVNPCCLVHIYNLAVNKKLHTHQ
jgi:hypothetical protein